MKWRAFCGFSVFLLYLFIFPASAPGEGIPEPSLILYGTIRNTAVFNARMTSGTLHWKFERRTPASTNVWFFSTSLGNVLGQFSYVLEVPCESLTGPVSTNALALVSSAVTFDRSQITYNGSAATMVSPASNSISLAARDRGRIERIDFTVNIPCEDLDGLGLCDEWEVQHFGSIGHSPADDEDGDGHTNLQELQAGTHPNDYNSVLQFIAWEPVGPAMRLEWPSAENRAYSIFRASNIMTLAHTNGPQGPYTVISSNILATPPKNSYLDNGAGTGGPYFYLLQVQP